MFIFIIKSKKVNLRRRALKILQLLIPSNIKASGGTHKTRGEDVELKTEIYRVGNDKVIAKVGTTSSHK
jgi:hypothetical protein|tara:strand:- start:126 stop:332 length:207 start_codon:yes stop_codon:yes gene_type:complete